jgi:UDP-N-acetylglucosamine 2-epimerase (non-hydrolysing)
MKIDVVIGTRPEAIKLAPVVRALNDYGGFTVRTIFTGQHTSLMAGIETLFDLRPDLTLDAMPANASLNELNARLLTQLGSSFSACRPDVVVVQGDTSSAFYGALAAYNEQIPVAHVEAGLRTGDRYAPWPEELHRSALARIAELHFAPTRKAFDQLKKEGCTNVHLTGNTVVDALQWIRAAHPSALTSTTPRKQILVTVHRREAFDSQLEQIFRAIRYLVDQHDEVDVLFPVHLNPVVQDMAKRYLADHPRINLCAPLNYLEMVHAMESSYLLMTDSGGLQEEAPSYQLPTLVLREKTERTEAIDAGVAHLCGTDFDAIVKAAHRLITDQAAHAAMRKSGNPFGDGLAAIRIAEILVHHFAPNPEMSTL